MIWKYIDSLSNENQTPYIYSITYIYSCNETIFCSGIVSKYISMKDLQTHIYPLRMRETKNQIANCVRPLPLFGGSAILFVSLYLKCLSLQSINNITDYFPL